MLSEKAELPPFARFRHKSQKNPIVSLPDNASNILNKITSLKGRNMKKKMRNSNNSDMRDEYDVSGGVRGKHYKAYRKGHTVIVHKDDGSASVQYFTQEDGSVMLDPDVKVYFPDSESVNKALRSLIA